MKMLTLNNSHTKETIKFVLVGILNTIVGYGSYFIGITLGLHYTISLLISTIIGIIHSFFWNKYWTFKSKGNIKTELAKFISVYAISFFANLGILVLLIEKFNIGKKIAGLYSLILITIISYFGHKLWSFRK